MNSPKFENKGTRYCFEWPEVKCVISRIKQNQEHTNSQLLFETIDNSHILRTRLNLEASSSKSRLAKDLSELLSLKKDTWQDIVEYISEKSLRELEQGEPVIEITSRDDTTPLEYIIYPVLPKGKPTVIFGDPGSAKSQQAVLFSIMMALPWHDNPMRLKVNDSPSVPLFLDYEADPDDVRRQVTSLVNGMNLGYMRLHYRRCTLPLHEDIEAIMNHADVIKADCLIIDSTSLAAGNDLNKMEAASNYFRALRQTHLTTLSLSHTSKDRESKSKTIIGSVLWEAGARSVWESRVVESEDCLDVALFHRKSNLARKSPPIGFQIHYENDLPVNVIWHDSSSVPEFIERMGNNKRILELLKGGSLTTKEMTEGLEISYAAAGVALKRMASKNLVIKLPDGKSWGLPAYDS